jgi:hypothetical protein
MGAEYRGVGLEDSRMYLLVRKYLLTSCFRCTPSLSPLLYPESKAYVYVRNISLDFFPLPRWVDTYSDAEKYLLLQYLHLLADLLHQGHLNERCSL